MSDGAGGRFGGVRASGWAVALVCAPLLGCSILVTTEGLSGGNASDEGGSAGGSEQIPAGGGIEAGSPSPVPSSDSGIVAHPSDAGADAATDASSAPPAQSDSGGTSTGEDAGSSPPAKDAGPPTCPSGNARVFVTSAETTGALGGVSGADALCGSAATAAGINGHWRAWLSDTNVPAFDHIAQSSGAFVLVDGTVVASSFAELVSGSLDHAIDEDEEGQAVSDGYTEVWTGIDLTGAMNSGFCTGSGDWTSSSSNASTPLVGHLNASDSTWTAAYLQFCDRSNVRLYCFEVCP